MASSRYNTAVSKITLVPHPVLRTKAAPIDAVSPQVLTWLKDLTSTLRNTIDPPGVGLAAPQISQPWRAFVTQLDQDAPTKNPIRLFINPKIIDQADKLILGASAREPDLEGCLSIPLLYGPLLRSEWVTVEWQTLDWQDQLAEHHTETFFDFSARVIQHELDHLNGVLFTDHIQQQQQPLYRAENDKLIEVTYDLVKEF